jgi:TolA-binding protein
MLRRRALLPLSADYALADASKISVPDPHAEGATAMSDNVIDIHAITDPDTVKRGDKEHPIDDLKGQLTNMRRHYENRGIQTIYVKSLSDLVRQAQEQAKKKGTKIRNLIIAGHGDVGIVRVGTSGVNGDKYDAATLAGLKPFLAKDADVYILACHTGQREETLRSLSNALGGVKVHGYTGSIVTTDYWIDVGMVEEGKHIVCFKNRCDEPKAPVPSPEQERRDARFESSTRRI